MKLPVFLTAAIAVSCPLPASFGELLFSDNFNAPDIDNLDQSDQTGRRSGLNTNIQVRSSRIQHGIIDNQLNFLNTGSGRIRFHEDLDNDTTTAEIWQDWASGDVGAQILAEGGFRIEFDWVVGNNTSANWVSVNVGFEGEVAGEPGTRVNNPDTDIGILFRYNGATELFSNGSNFGAQGSFEPTLGVRHVAVEYYFDSFEDDAAVGMRATVDGTEVYSGTEFFWSNNFGELYFEIGTLENTLLDNVSISGAAAEYGVALSPQNFLSSLAEGAVIGALSAANGPDPVPSSYSLVAGEGDSDNGKFQIMGDQLQVGAFDFLNEAEGTEYSIRVQANADTGGLTTAEVILVTVSADMDSDQLPDAWEIAKAGNITDLNGLASGPGPGAGTGDFDGDTLTDSREFELDTPLANPGIDPTLADSDGDDLGDGAELEGVGDRPATNPVDADSDDDSLSDGQESNTGAFVDAGDTGSDPTVADTDADGYRDGFEVLRGGNPTDFDRIPPLSPSVALSVLTDDASSGIDSAKTYTHAISPGGFATINDVDFEDFGANLPLDNFTWDTGELLMNEILAINYGDWDPDFAGVTDFGLQDLFGGFTYSSNGADAGAVQTFTLGGLTPGQGYLLRIFVRLWDTEGSGREIDLSFTNGEQVAYAPILEDRPGVVLEDPDAFDAAYSIEYSYVAASTELVVTAPVPAGAAAGSGSFHLYGLANEVVGEVPDRPIEITGLEYDATVPKFSITFDSVPETDYALDFTTNLQAGENAGDWAELSDTVRSQGTSTTVEDVQVPGTGAAAVFYRIRLKE